MNYNTIEIKYEIDDINIILELYRHKVYNDIRKNFIKSINRIGMILGNDPKSQNRRIIEALSLWTFTQNMFAETQQDPLIPTNAKLHGPSVVYFMRFNRRKRIENLYQKINQALRELSGNCNQGIKQIKEFVKSKKYLNQIFLVKHEKEDKTHKFIVSRDKINQVFPEIIVLEVLKIDDLVHQNLTRLLKLSKIKYPGDIKTLFYCLIVRYYTIQGGNIQGSIPHFFVQELRKIYDINFEIFASPFNCFLDYYCSAFYDIEKYFNSAGSFKNITIKSGFYEVNPPFDKFIIEQVSKKIIKWLDETDQPLAFFIVIPVWDMETAQKIHVALDLDSKIKNMMKNRMLTDDYKGYLNMKKSKYFYFNEVLYKHEHKYYNYVGKSVQILNTSNSHVIIMKNDKYPDIDKQEFVKVLKELFVA